MKIYLDEPNLNTKDLFAVNQCLFGSNISTVGRYTEEFENAIAKYLGSGFFCVATNSGTAALFVALKSLDIGHGDEVIIPATTFIATANAVAMTGARPVIVDIDKDTWNIDPVEIEKAITSKTRAIMPVHLYGNPCDMDKIMQLAKDYQLYVVEDAAESLGATYNGKHMGTIGDIGCISFNRNKVITTGGGGMIVTKNANLAKKIKQFVNQGRDITGVVNVAGFNFGMTNQNAALGLSQLNRLNEFFKYKGNFRQIYLGFLFNEKNITLQHLNTTSHSFASFWFNAIKIDTNKTGKYITDIMLELKEKGIPTRRIFEPIWNFKAYDNSLIVPSNAYDLFENGLCLPSSTLNTYENIEYVCSALLEVLKL